MEIVYWGALDEKTRSRYLERSRADIESVLPAVQAIIDDVRENGDDAIRRLTKKHDGVDLGESEVRVSQAEIAAATSLLPASVKLALTKAIENVRSFHERQIEKNSEFSETSPGIYATERARAIPSVGLYVPRGRGSFPSMLYMLAVPATLAGVERVCIATPPLSDGTVDPACLYAAELCGIDEIYRIGGAQAIAAFTYGTESVSPVLKIVGPGSVYVAAAKRIVYGRVDVGLPAGPSESVILADDNAAPWKVALDMTIEAEHGADSQALLITPSSSLAEEVARLLPQLVDELPEPRKSYVKEVFSNYGGIIICESMEAAVELVDRVAPEHLSIQTRDPFVELSSIHHAAEILLGEHTPFSLANYAAGPNAVLPTGGTARIYSPVSVRDFIKYSSVIYATEHALANMSDTVTVLADYEGFPAHARALRRRNGE